VRRAAVAAAATLVLVTSVVAAAGASTAVRFTPVTHGTTTPNGRQTPTAYLAPTKAAEAPFAARLDAASRRAVARVDLRRNVVVAVFLDGFPCSSDLGVSRVLRSGKTLSVHVAYTPPPVGVATCVRTSTPYLVVAVSRSSLGAVLPTRVVARAAARA
jgi:hypothetical protein